MITKRLPIKVLSFLAVLIFYLLLARYTESIPVSSGLGWDGTIYAKIAMSPVNSLLNGVIEYERIQRVLPCFISHMIMTFMSRDYNTPNTIISFQIMNAIAMTIVTFYWIKLCNLLNFTRGATIISLCLLVINFQFVKLYSYYHVLTDYFSYCITILFIYYWMKGHVIYQIVLILLSAFTWPALFYQSILMFIFPYKSNDIYCNYYSIQNFILRSKYFNIIKCSAIILLLFYLRDELINPDIDNILCLVNIIFLFYIFITIGLNFFKKIPSVSSLTVLKLKYIAYLLPVFLLVFAYRIFTPSRISDVDPIFVIKLFIERNFQFPFLNILSHTINFSPIIIVVIVFFNQTVRVCKRYGIGLMLAFIFSFIFILNTESRHLLHVYPIYIIIFASMFDFTYYSIISTLFLQLISCSFYVNFNYPIFDEKYLLSFFGAFTNEYYYTHYILPIGLVILIVYFFVLSKLNLKIIN